MPLRPPLMRPQFLPLHCHPAQPGTLPLAVSGSASMTDSGDLQLAFALRGELAALRLPAWQADAGFADGLWQHTCFEAFVGTPDSPVYREFNLSPCGQWAVYAFDDYRQRDEAWQPTCAPRFSVQQHADTLTLDAHIPAALLPDPRAGFDVSLTAVIEHADGSLSYRALAHAGDHPDFHLRDSFALRLSRHTTLS